MAKEKVRLWDRLKYKYKLSVINETSYEEVFNFRLSQLHVLTALSVLAVILVVLTILLIAFTGLREFIPGYPDGNMRQMIAQNALRVDSLENELLKRDRFFKSIRLVLNGGDTTSLERSREDTARYRNDTIRFQISEQENEFRAAIEERERFNLSLGMKEQNHDYYHFFPPVEGIVTQSFDEKKRHYGTDIVAKANAKVAAVLDAVRRYGSEQSVAGRGTACGNDRRRKADLLGLDGEDRICDPGATYQRPDFCIQTQFYPIEKTGRLCQGRRGPGGSGKYRRGVQRPPFAF